MPYHRLRQRYSHVAVPPLPSRAIIDDLRYIRETMERSSSFTAVPGWGQIFMGLTALGAAWLASRASSPLMWLRIWIVEAVVALILALSFMYHKAIKAGSTLTSGPGRKFAFSFLPPVASAAFLTAVFLSAHVAHVIPGTWLLLYGTGVVTAGAFSVPSVPVMGFCFMFLGVSALFSPAAWSNVFMALGFGGLHIVFGAWIAGRHGG